MVAALGYQCTYLCVKDDVRNELLVQKMANKDFEHKNRGSASLDMCIMDHLMRGSILALMDSFFKLKSPNLVQM